jgi:hypothetical protein
MLIPTDHRARYHDAVQLLLKRHFQTCANKAKENVVVIGIPPKWLIHNSLLITYVSKDWNEVECSRLAVEQICSMFNSRKHRADFKAFRKYLDLLERWQTEDKDKEGGKPRNCKEAVRVMRTPTAAFEPEEDSESEWDENDSDNDDDPDERSTNTNSDPIPPETMSANAALSHYCEGLVMTWGTTTQALQRTLQTSERHTRLLKDLDATIEQITGEILPHLETQAQVDQDLRREAIESFKGMQGMLRAFNKSQKDRDAVESIWIKGCFEQATGLVSVVRGLMKTSGKQRVAVKVLD